MARIPLDPPRSPLVRLTEWYSRRRFVAWDGEEPLMTMSLVVTDGLVSQVLVVRNPDKLAALRGPP